MGCPSPHTCSCSFSPQSQSSPTETRNTHTRERDVKQQEQRSDVSNALGGYDEWGNSLSNSSAHSHIQLKVSEKFNSVLALEHFF